MASLKGAGEIDEKSILKFPETSKMATTKGKKEGDITVFREGTLSFTRHGAKGLYVERRQLGVRR